MIQAKVCKMMCIRILHDYSAIVDYSVTNDQYFSKSLNDIALYVASAWSVHSLHFKTLQEFTIHT